MEANLFSSGSQSLPVHRPFWAFNSSCFLVSSQLKGSRMVMESDAVYDQLLSNGGWWG